MLVATVAGVVDERRDDFPPPLRRLRAAAQVEGEERAVVRFDHTLEVREVDVVAAQTRVVEAAEAARERALGAPLGEEHPVHLGAADDVVLRVGEADRVERLEPQPHAPSRRSTYFARTSTSRFTFVPAESAASVVAASVCGTSATLNPSSASPATVRLTPSTVT